MDIGWAAKALKNWEHVTRSGWNGNRMHVEMRAASEAGDAWHPSPPCLVIWTADEVFVPWTCSQSDFMAEDWKLA